MKTKSDKLERLLVEEIVNYGIYAPTNNYALRAILVDDQEILEKLDRISFQFVSWIYNIFYKSKVVFHCLRKITPAAEFIVRELGADTPWHISRFFPDYQLMNVPITPQESLERAWEIGKSVGLRYVYLGNVPGEEKQNTYCPDCGTLLIRRNIFGVVANRIQSGCCPDCGIAVAGVGISEKSQSASALAKHK